MGRRGRSCRPPGGPAAFGDPPSAARTADVTCVPGRGGRGPVAAEELGEELRADPIERVDPGNSDESVRAAVADRCQAALAVGCVVRGRQGEDGAREAAERVGDEGHPARIAAELGGPLAGRADGAGDVAERGRIAAAVGRRGAVVRREDDGTAAGHDAGETPEVRRDCRCARGPPGIMTTTGRPGAARHVRAARQGERVHLQLARRVAATGDRVGDDDVPRHLDVQGEAGRIGLAAGTGRSAAGLGRRSVAQTAARWNGVRRATWTRALPRRSRVAPGRRARAHRLDAGHAVATSVTTATTASTVIGRRSGRSGASSRAGCRRPARQRATGATVAQTHAQPVGERTRTTPAGRRRACDGSAVADAWSTSGREATGVEDGQMPDPGAHSPRTMVVSKGNIHGSPVAK